jgi:exopolyphosphatase/guanosine-5'-triphosphate,3'-diphosphate pyrophosphatase
MEVNMGNYKAFNIIAVIDIGSNYIKMIIAEVDGKSKIKVLDQVVKYTNIGKDTFQYWKNFSKNYTGNMYYFKEF